MKQLIILYDDWCPNCTRFAKFVKKWDWLDLVTIYKLRNEHKENIFKYLDRDKAENQMASFKDKWYYGYNSLYLISLRLPLFCFFVPFLFFLKITSLGNILYKEIALKRTIIPIHCNKEKCQL